MQVNEKMISVSEAQKRLGITHDELEELVSCGELSLRYLPIPRCKFSVAKAITEKSLLELEEKTKKSKKIGRSAVSLEKNPCSPSSYSTQVPHHKANVRRLPMFRNRGMGTQQSITSRWFIEPDGKSLVELPDSTFRSSF